MKIRNVFKGLFGFKQTTQRKQRPFVRPRLEELEGRIAPATNLWIGPPGGVFGTAANFVNPVPISSPPPVYDQHTPAPGDYLTFSGNTYGTFSGSTTASAVDGGYTVDRVDMDSSYSGPLSIPAGKSITTTDYFTDYGTLLVYPGASVNTLGDYHLTGGSIVTATPLFVNASNGVNDLGAIDVMGGGDLAITTGAFVENLDGIILVEPGGVLTISATTKIDFEGQIVVMPGGALVLAAPLVIGGGSIIGTTGPHAGPVTLPLPATPTTAIAAATYINELGTLTTGTVVTAAGVAAKIAALNLGPVAGTVDINAGTFTVNPGAVVDGGDGSQINSTGITTIQGTVNITDASGTLSSLLLQSGTLNLNADSYGAGTLTVSATADVDAASTANLQTNSTLTVDGNLTLEGTVNMTDANLNVSGSLLMTAGTLTATGNSTTTPSTIAATGTVNVDPNSTLTLNGVYGWMSMMVLSAKQPITDNGTITMNNAFLNTNGNNLVVKAIPTAPGIFNIIGVSEVQLQGGELDIEGTLNQSGTGGSESYILGTLYVNGTYNFLDPAGGSNLMESVTNYVQTAAGLLLMNILGSGTGAGNDRLNVTGTATLAGTFQINVTGSPMMGSWNLITAGGFSGNFSTVTLPAPPPNDQWSFGIVSDNYEITLSFSWPGM